MSVGNQNTRITKPFESQQVEELATRSVRAPTEAGEPAPPQVPLAAASGRMPRNADTDLRPTSKLHKDELLGLLDLSAGTASTPAEPRPAHARLVPAGSTSEPPATTAKNSDDDDDRQTQRMQAKHFRELVESGQPLPPALLESVDWYKDADAAAAEKSRPHRAPEAVLDELGREPSRKVIVEAEPVPAAPAPGPARAKKPRTSVEVQPVSGHAEARREDASLAARPFGAALLQSAPSSSTRLFIGLIVVAIVAFACYIGFVMVP